MSIKQYVFKKGARNRIPVSGTFELTPRCNLNCKMCYVHMTSEEQKLVAKELTKEQWISLGKEAVEAGMIYLLLTGGEPLLRPDFQEIYKTLLEMGLIITINTNGTLITPEIAEFFYYHRPEKVNITLYGSSDDTYEKLCGNSKGFEAAIKGIRLLKNKGIRVNINTTFTKLNEKDLEQIVAFAKKEKIPVRTAAFTFPPIRNQHEESGINLRPMEAGRLGAKFDKLTMEPEQIEKRKKLLGSYLEMRIPENEPESRVSACMAGKGAFWISWNGEMYPCGMLPNHSVSILEKDFKTAWNLILEKQSEMFIPAKCSICNRKAICPICSAVAESVGYGKEDIPEVMCQFTKSYVEEFLK